MINGKRVLGVLNFKSYNYPHKAFFESVCDEVINLNLPHTGSAYLPKRIESFIKFNRPEYARNDIILCESTFQADLYKKFLGRNKILISLVASPQLYLVSEKRIGPVKLAIMKSLIGENDGFIPVSKMAAGWVEKSFNRPYRICYPFSQDEKYDLLMKNKYDSSSKNIFCVGSSAHLKGMDLLIDAFNMLDDSYSLTLVSSVVEPEILEKINANPRIKLLSGLSIEQLCAIYSKSGVYMHLARADTFPVSTLEAMYGGLPTFVSTMSGTKEVVEKVDPRFVCELDSKLAAQKLKWFFDLSQKDKENYSVKFRQVASPFNSRECLKQFRLEFESLVNSILLERSKKH